MGSRDKRVAENSGTRLMHLAYIGVVADYILLFQQK